MTSATYRVVARGLQPGYSAEMAADLVAALFKCSKDKIAPFVSTTPTTVKRGMTFDAATRYVEAVRRCGCICVVEEDSAPRATVLRYAAQLVHGAPAMAALTLSEERLRRVQPRLFDPTQWSTQADRDSLFETLRHTLARGESCAAVVVNARNAVVAALSHELDCIVLVQFDPGLALVHGWQDGTRLLAANAYFARDQGIAPDVQPGANDTGRWGNVWPLIADLLTDDQAILADRKRAIADTEWTRTWELGQRALGEGVTPRDGRPASSRKPVQVHAAPLTPSTPLKTVSVAKRARQAGMFGASIWAIWRAARYVLRR